LIFTNYEDLDLSVDEVLDVDDEQQLLIVPCHELDEEVVLLAPRSALIDWWFS